MTERLTDDMTEGREGHEFRYRLAAGFIRGGDHVLDAACGTGYGERFMTHEWINYHGVDIVDCHPGRNHYGAFTQVDLQTWQPDFAYDVFVSFETIEHLADYSNLIHLAKQAREWALLSVPVVLTKHENPYHVHDFGPGDLQCLMVDPQWRHYQTVQQPSEFSEISVFERVAS